MENSLVLIQDELEKAREKLKGVEDVIKKSIGRDIIGPPGNRGQGFKRRAVEPLDGNKEVQRPRIDNSSVGGGVSGGVILRGARGATRVASRFERGRLGGGNTNNNNNIKDERVSVKKRLGEPATVTVFSRLSGPPKDEVYEQEQPITPSPQSQLQKPLTSQVVATDNTPSRKDILAAQSGDNLCRARNRRMFGALLGTLRKFRQEEDALKEKEEKRANVERKLEEAATREKEELKRKRQELFSDRRKRKFEIRQLEFKLARLKQFSDWESSRKHLMNFIKTKASPQIFFLPKVHSDKSRALLEETKGNIQKIIVEKKEEIEQIIADHAEKNKGGDGDDEEEEEDGEIRPNKAAKDRCPTNEIDDDEDIDDVEHSGILEESVVDTADDPMDTTVGQDDEEMEEKEEEVLDEEAEAVEELENAKEDEDVEANRGDDDDEERFDYGDDNPNEDADETRKDVDDEEEDEINENGLSSDKENIRNDLPGL